LGFRLERPIAIYEHGLEASTISGELVRNRLRYAVRASTKDVVLATGALTLFVVSLALLSIGSVSSDPTLEGHLERFSTAMATTTVVAGYSIFHLRGGGS
jgi:hypothetical protein